MTLTLMLDRERAGREASPTAGVIDSRSAAPASGAQRGYDAGKKIVGRKRHTAVDTDGRLLIVNPTPADIPVAMGGTCYENRASLIFKTDSQRLLTRLSRCWILPATETCGDA